MTDVGALAHGPVTEGHWGRVRVRLGRRRLFAFALFTLSVLYGAAIFAPLIANDRPYVLEAIDYKSYEAARKRLYFSVLGLDGLLEKTASEYEKTRTGGSVQTYADALRAEGQALSHAIATMGCYLDEETASGLGVFQSEFERVIRFGLEERRQEAGRLVLELKQRAMQVREDYRASETAGEGHSVVGVSLKAHRSYPLFASLSAFEVFFMVLWVGAVGLHLTRRTSFRRFGGLLALCSLAAVLTWSVQKGGENSYYPAYKDGLTSGKIQAVRAVFPPLAFGFAEAGSESHRPPTWHRSSEIDAEGFYAYGHRSGEADEFGIAAPANPVEVRFAEPERNSAWRHPLGTDGLGRDLFVRAIYGGRISLSVGLVSTIVLALIGIFLGAVAGYFGGRVDLLISRLIEVVICFPSLFLILAVVVFLGPGLITIMLVIGLVRWTSIARLTRGEFLRLRELEFVDAARSLGLSTPRILVRHILPNAIGPILVAATFSIAAGLLIESSLAFLGLGISEPIPSWGALVRTSKNPAHWWIHAFPGALIFLTVLCYNLIGDAVRDALDPKLN